MPDLTQAAVQASAHWDLAQLAALAAALGWASGMRLYAAVFITGAVGYAGWVALPPGLAVLQHPVLLIGSFVMVCVEFIADKIPGVDTLWDAVHTVVRIPAGAALAAAVFGGGAQGDVAAWALLAALMGGTLAATAHTAKATTRAAANTSPEPFSNIALSLAGDLAVPGLLWLAFEHPLMLLPVVALLAVLALVLIALLFRFLRALFKRFAARPGPAIASPR